MASGAGSRVSAASSCAWSMTRGSGAVTGIGRSGSVGVRCCCRCRFGGTVTTLGSGGEVFIEAAAAVLVEAGATAGALVSLVALLGAGEAAGEMGGEASAVAYRSSQSYYSVDFEGGLLRDMPTEPSGQIRSHPTGVGSCPGPRSSPGFVVSSLRSPLSPPPGGWATSITFCFAELCFFGASPEGRAPEDSLRAEVV